MGLRLEYYKVHFWVVFVDYEINMLYITMKVIAFCFLDTNT